MKLIKDLGKAFHHNKANYILFFMAICCLIAFKIIGIGIALVLVSMILYNIQITLCDKTIELLRDMNFKLWGHIDVCNAEISRCHTKIDELMIANMNIKASLYKLEESTTTDHTEILLDLQNLDKGEGYEA